MNELKNKIRRNILKASYEVKACHIGSALSCVDILVDLFWNKMKKEDIFLFAKASGVATLYCILAEKGYFDENKISYYLKNYPLASKKVPGVIHSIGSLGHGLNVACGIALAKKLRNEQGIIYCLISDGECQEGTFWEAMLFKNQHCLQNLKIIVDWNGLQACGRIEDILNIPWNFIKSFGVEVVQTIKGSGGDTACKIFENNNDWHYKNLDKETYEKALLELNS